MIPTLNEERFLPGCLESLSQQTFKDFEIIIVDSGSKDATLRIARKYTKKIVYEPKLGFAIAKNRGAKEARGDILVFTDADSLYPGSWLESIAKHFEDRDVVAVGGPLVPIENRLRHRLMFKLTTDYIARVMKVFGFVIFQAPNSSFRRDAFEKAGRFNEKMRMLEDNEFPNRIKKLGKVVFDPSLAIQSSARRFEKVGYFMETLRYWKAYFDLYVLKKSLSEEYKLYR